MEQTRRRRNVKHYNPTILLLGLVLVLAVIFVVVLCIALGGGETNVPGNTTGSTTLAPEGTSTSPIETTIPRELAILEPQKTEAVALEPKFTFRGTSDPNHS